MKWVTPPGHDIDWARPPARASIWSARITAMASVISAWRSSWPWFQRRNTSNITQPDDRGDRRADEQRDDPRQHVDVLGRDVALLADHPLLHLDGDVGGEQEEGAVGHVDGAHQPEDQREPGGDDEVQPGRREPVEQGDDELAGLVDRRSGRRAAGEEQHPGRATKASGIAAMTAHRSGRNRDATRGFAGSSGSEVSLTRSAVMAPMSPWREVTDRAARRTVPSEGARKNYRAAAGQSRRFRGPCSQTSQP